MKILLLTTHINVGGVGIYILNLAKYLKKAGHHAVVVSSGGELEPELLSEGIEHVPMDIKTKFEFGLKIWIALPRLIRMVKDGEFQVIHAQTRVAQVMAFLASRASGVPYVTTCHGFFKHKRLARAILPCWGDKVIAISKSVERHLIDDFKVGPARVSQVYNGIELGKFLAIGERKDHAFLKEIGLSPDDIVVGSIGRLSPVKGFKYLIRAFKIIAEKDRRVKLLFIGEGPEEKVLRQVSRELGLSDRVVFYSGGETTEKYLSLFDIFCLPSLHEGLGLSLMEAMAAGKTCVASDVGGISELVTNGENGLLFKPADPGSIAEAVLKLIEDKHLAKRLSGNARLKARDNYSIEDSVRKTTGVYEEAIGYTTR